MKPLEPRPAASFEFREVLYEKRDRVARVTLNRPQAYNALSANGTAKWTLFDARGFPLYRAAILDVNTLGGRVDAAAQVLMVPLGQLDRAVGVDLGPGAEHDGRPASAVGACVPEVKLPPDAAV